MVIFNLFYLSDLGIRDVGLSVRLEIADYEMVLGNLMHISL